MGGKFRNLTSRGVAPLNPGNLAADDVSWPSTAMLRGYDGRRFGRCLGGGRGSRASSWRRLPGTVNPTVASLSRQIIRF